jgi:predicted dehydrogenase
MNRRQFIAASAISSFALATHAADANRKLRIAIIGHTGQGDYGHGVDTMWLKIPDVEIVAVADAEPKGLASAEKKLSVSKLYPDYRKMLAETKPDLVAVATRQIHEHRDMTIASIDAGARGIYMEKPFCRSLVEADELVAACEKKNVKLAIAHRNRYHPALPVIAKLIKDDAIGQLLEIRGRGKEDARGGSQDLWVLGSHVLNLAVYFTGKPLTCTAQVLQDRKPVTRADVKDGAEGIGPLAGNEVHARFETASGVPIFFDSIAKAGIAAQGFGLQLVGNKGIIDLRVDSHPIAHILPGSPFPPAPGKEARAWIPITTAGIGKPEPITDIKEQVGGHLVAARDLIAAIRENREPLCGVNDGRLTVEMISSIFESHRLNGLRVPLPLKTRQNPLTLL